MIEEEFVTLLSDLASVYPAYLPERAGRPAIVYRRISTNSSLHHDGPVDIVEARFQFSAHAETHPEALALARRIRSVLHGRNGGVTTGGILLVRIDNEIDLGWDIDAESWEFTLDAFVHYKE